MCRNHHVESFLWLRGAKVLLDEVTSAQGAGHYDCAGCGAILAHSREHFWIAQRVVATNNLDLSRGGSRVSPAPPLPTSPYLSPPLSPPEGW